jgi:hypothetical protein
MIIATREGASGVHTLLRLQVLEPLGHCAPGSTARLLDNDDDMSELCQKWDAQGAHRRGSDPSRPQARVPDIAVATNGSEER